jgi:type III pantothenate kinase
MSQCVAVDIGNTRIKWGLCQSGTVAAMASLPVDEAAWQRQFDAWQLGPGQSWIVSGVQPQRREIFLAWLARHDATVRHLESNRDLPLTVALEEPQRVGIDRLLNAVAVNRHRAPGTAAVIIDAGSAVTVDLVDGSGAFRGGAIYPGLRLMAQALHDYTAQLPIVEVRRAFAPPGTSTAQAIEVGIYHAVLGGAERMARELQTQAFAAVYLTGGDAVLLAKRFIGPHMLWPEMTLAGILYSALSEPAA